MNIALFTSVQLLTLTKTDNETDSDKETCDISGYGYQPSPAPALNGSNGSNGGGRRGPTIKWTKEGVSTSAERRLPFVHRFRPVDLPPPVGLVNAASASVSGQQTGQQQPTYSHASGALGPHVSKALNKMSQYETNPVGALQERYQSRGVLPRYVNCVFRLQMKALYQLQ